MTTEKLLRFALYGFCGIICAVGLWLLIEYALPILLPFGVAYALSCGVRPIARWLHKKTKTSHAFWAVVLIILTAALLTALIWFGASILIREASDAIASMSDMLNQPDNPVSRFADKIESFGKRFHLGSGDFSDTLPEMVKAAVTQISTWVAGGAGDILGHLPSFVFTLFVGIIALFYFCLDSKGISKMIGGFLPRPMIEKASKTASVIMRGLGRFVKAYFVIMMITFVELLCGFLVMRVRYAFLAALLIAIIDVLPVLGVGTVLIPWSALSFIEGDAVRGIQLLVLLGVMYIVRQAVEPRILGKNAGVHPVVALIFVYAGFCLAGVVGMILAPILLNAGAVLWEEREKKSDGKVDKQRRGVYNK